MINEFCGSVFWNSSESWYLSKPIFTKCFKDLVFAWMPCLLYWLLLPFEIFYLKSSYDKNIPWNKINLIKSILNGLLLILCAVDLVTAIVVSNDDAFGTCIYPVDIWTPIVKLATFSMILACVFLNRKHGIHTSGGQFLFWLILVLCSICRILTSSDAVEKDIFWSKYKYTSFVINFALIIGQLILNCFADEPPRETKYPLTNKSIPERSAGFLSRITYHWFDRMAWKGFRKPLTAEDLWQLRPQEMTKEIMQKFNKNFMQQIPTIRGKNQLTQDISMEDKKHTVNQSSQSVSIIPPIIKSFADVFLFGSLMKLLTDLLTFGHPQILRAIIEYVESNDTEETPIPQWVGVGYAILLFLTTSIQTIVLCQYFHRMFIVGLRIRSALISTIYRKALVISNVARRDFTTGEIVNLMAVDAQRFMDLTTYLNMIWSAPLQIGLALYFLWEQLGPSVLAGLVVMIILIPINAAIAGRIKSFQVKQMEYKDQRVKLMNEILTGIKVIKLNAWEKSFENQILGLRDKEMATLKATAYLNATTFFLMFTASFLVSSVTFATYVLIDDTHVLDATKAFVSLSLFNILNFPLNTLPMLITNIVQAQVSVKRINKFMNSPELNPQNVEHAPNVSYPITIENGNFTWDDNSIEVTIAMQLRNINIKVRSQKLLAIVGPVGSGKSSIIQAILGEMTRLTGCVNVDGTIAYVPQQAWIQNATIRENILFGRPYDRERYARIISACALSSDIELFAAGDLTEIGERGINLSGGQKQRISMARAIYSDASIYLLDDPLSAVDVHVGRHMFQQIIGPKGLLSGKTRVLVTHGIMFLPQVDYIYVLKSGEISESGSYTALMERNDAFANFAKQYMHKESETVAVSDDGNDGNVVDVVNIANDKLENSVKNSEENATAANIMHTTENSMKIVEKTDGKLIELENLEMKNVRFAVYKHYIRNVGVFLSVTTLLLICIFQVFQISSNLWLTKWSNDKRLVNDTSLRCTYVGVYFGFGFLQAIASFLAMLALSIGCVYCSRQLHAILLWNVLRWPMVLFDITPVGRIINRFSKDIETLDNALPQNWRMILMQAYALLATIIVISISTPVFLAVIVPIAIIYGFVQRVYVTTSRQLIRIESISRSPIYSHFGETLLGVSSIRAYGVKERFTDMSDAKVDQHHTCQYPALIANRWLSIRLEMIGNLIIFFASIFAVLGGQSNAGLVGLSVSYALQITDTLKWLVRLSSDIENNIVAVERIKEYSELEQEATWTNNKTISLPKDWPSAGKIVFENLHVRYRDELDLVLKDLSFTVSSGEKVGIIGRTGAGKSSLTLSLFRLIESTAGRILIDDIDIAKLGLHKLRSRLTIIPQDPVLFCGTLRSNVDPFALKSDAEIWRSLELSHLKEFAKSLPTGLNYQIEEGGVNLSLGQRQLICLARAVLRKSKILVLDEATAAIDLETDELIQRTIRSEFDDCTVLTIAHRLNTILDYDKIIVLDSGTLAESGTVSELLSDRNSIFYAMAKNAQII